mmetsp:Transcript_4089/g.6019  ORF Transcript_4089/g.6019 Transcript_4089/m.6019 type:complete len:166 (+) Transcript_4089:12-509(+)
MMAALSLLLALALAAISSNARRSDHGPDLYFDAKNIPPWLTPPWIHREMRVGPMFYPIDPAVVEKEPGNVEPVPQPILPYSDPEEAFLDSPSYLDAIETGNTGGPTGPAIFLEQSSNKKDNHPKSKSQINGRKNFSVVNESARLGGTHHVPFVEFVSPLPNGSMK